MRDMWKILPIRPAKGGYLRPFGCAEFIRDFSLTLGPHGTPQIDPALGAPQSDIFFYYKQRSGLPLTSPLTRGFSTVFYVGV